MGYTEEDVVSNDFVGDSRYHTLQKNLGTDHGFQNLVMVLKRGDHFQVKYL